MSCCQHVGYGDMTSFLQTQKRTIYTLHPNRSTSPTRGVLFVHRNRGIQFMLKANFDLQVGNKRRAIPSSGKQHWIGSISKDNETQCERTDTRDRSG
jgi:hypothetical protein